MLADAAATPVLINSLGPAAEGIEGTSPTADPATGFTLAYEEKFGHAPTDYAAPAYDAILLAAYVSARQDATLSESPEDSIRHVVNGNGTPESWNATGMHNAILAIQKGESPRISGASGPLIYDPEAGVDPLVMYYSHWVVENGSFRTIAAFGSAKPGTTGTPVAWSRASDTFLSPASSVTESGSSGPVKKDFWAVIVGPSQGWSNYRHEADALTMYTMLRANGVPDDHIILMLYDDIPTNVQNPLKGNVHSLPKGENIRAGAEVDYTGSQVTAAAFTNVLIGTKTGSTPVVLESNASTDVFVYVASHGDPGAVLFPGNDRFTTADFTNVTSTMNREQKYRQMVFMVDTCFGKSIASNATAPGILYLTGASSSEPSLGDVYDMDIRQWLSDEFTHEAVGLIRANPDITFRELYIGTYDRVTGSHVSMVTTENVSTLQEPVRTFFSP